MKITFSRLHFLNAFQIAASISSPRSPKEVLSNVKLDVTDKVATLMATDMEAGVRIDLEHVKVEAPGKVLLQVLRFGNILRESSDDELTLVVGEKGLEITGKQSRFQLPHLNPDAFPTISSFGESSYFEIDGRVCRELIRRTIFATDSESTRYALGGVLFDISGEDIVAVATDGRRLAKMAAKGTPVGQLETSSSNIIVPMKTLSLIDKSIVNEHSKVQIAARQNDILVQIDRVMIYSRLVEGRYPNWKQVIPQRTDSNQAVSIVGPFFAAVRQASIVADQESRGVEFEVSNGNIVMRATTANIGESHVEVPITYEGPTMKMTLGSQFISDFLRVLDPDKNFVMDFVNESESVVFKTEDGYVNVIMPMARDH